MREVYRYANLTQAPAPPGYIPGSLREDATFPFGTLDYPQELSTAVQVANQMLFVCTAQEESAPCGVLDALTRLRAMSDEMARIANTLPYRHQKAARRIAAVCRLSGPGFYAGTLADDINDCISKEVNVHIPDIREKESRQHATS